MVCVGILSSRNKFPYSKPYFAYCTYLSHYSESDSVLDMTKVLHFKIENTPIKDTDGKRKFKRMLTFLFVNKRTLFAIRHCLSRNLTLFSTRRIGALGLFWTNKAARLTRFWRHLRYIPYSMIKEKYVFKREFLYL